MGPRVIVAMSGGVDSSVAAALLKNDGCEVIGVTFQLHEAGGSGCCSIRDVKDAFRVTRVLDIPHYVLNLREEFGRRVVADFLGEYRKGRTPNPCIRCNEWIKFDALSRKAKALGAQWIATGHYARILHDGRTGEPVLARAKDPSKDQSYVLYVLKREDLSRIYFPLGEFRKDETRRMACGWGLPVANKPDSQEICFVPDNDYRKFLAGRLPGDAASGPIIDITGRILGAHKGIIHYTIGQRKGLGLSAPEPLYVLEIVPSRNAVIVGKEEMLYQTEIRASQVNWLTRPLRQGEALEVEARIRHKAPWVRAVIECEEQNFVRILFKEPQRAAAPGQSVVFSRDERILGGGIIEEAVISSREQTRPEIPDSPES
ncbi:MAG: tRNA 2-thiouridine(34) synthase MnmA [Armatimonadetes bacterium]|nr:tRNA 2-thiouridine(34) synthase MnmA [Armatimonadota bacterium]